MQYLVSLVIIISALMIISSIPVIFLWSSIIGQLAWYYSSDFRHSRQLITDTFKNFAKRSFRQVFRNYKVWKNRNQHSQFENTLSIKNQKDEYNQQNLNTDQKDKDFFEDQRKSFISEQNQDKDSKQGKFSRKKIEKTKMITKNSLKSDQKIRKNMKSYLQWKLRQKNVYQIHNFYLFQQRQRGSKDFDEEKLIKDTIDKQLLIKLIGDQLESEQITELCQVLPQNPFYDEEKR